LAGAVGHAGVRRVGDHEQVLLGHRLELRELALAFLDPARERLHVVARRGELGRLLVELGHLLVGRVALLAQRVELTLQPAAALRHPATSGATSGPRRRTSSIRAGSSMRDSVPRFCNDREKLAEYPTSRLTTLASWGSPSPWSLSRPDCPCSSGPPL